VATFIDVQLDFETVGLPIPEITVGAGQARTVSVGPVGIGPFRLPDIREDLGRIVLPSFTVPDLDIRVDREFISIPGFDGFRLPTGVDADLEVQFVRIVVDTANIDVALPRSVELVGPTFETRRVLGFEPTFFYIPSLDVRRDTRRVGGDILDLPTIDLDLPTLDPPDVPELSVTIPAIPSVAVRVDQEPVPDPTTLRVTGGLILDAVRREVLSPLPAGLVSDPASYVLETVLSEAEARVGSGLRKRLAGLAEALLEASISEETAERLRERSRE